MERGGILLEGSLMESRIFQDGRGGGGEQILGWWGGLSPSKENPAQYSLFPSFLAGFIVA